MLELRDQPGDRYGLRQIREVLRLRFASELPQRGDCQEPEAEPGGGERLSQPGPRRRSELAVAMFPEDGCLHVQGVGDDGVTAFTNYGIECLRQIIADERAAGNAPPQVKSTK